VLIEQLFRNLGDDRRWNAKPVCLGLACIFAFDIYLYSEALLFGRPDEDARSVRGAVHLLSVPFLFVAAKRRVDWIAKLQVSRTAAFYSATLLHWTQDDSADFADTRAFIERRIDGVMRFEKTKAKLIGLGDKLPDPARFLGRLRYPAV
jgi:hypothetical protein